MCTIEAFLRSCVHFSDQEFSAAPCFAGAGSHVGGDQGLCHELWQSLGFDALDAIEDSERRARANFYFGQLQTARQLIEVLG